ncbi:MAG: ATPase, partial [Bacteroidales bacterium]|nr:ATPase [Bacteroidales bacterium]
EVDFLVDNYDTLSAMPIEVKSGKDFKKHRALDKFVDNEEYHIKNAIILSNEREVFRTGKVLYLPIYYTMFLQPSTPGGCLIP